MRLYPKSLAHVLMDVGAPLAHIGWSLSQPVAQRVAMAGILTEILLNQNFDQDFDQ